MNLFGFFRPKAKTGRRVNNPKIGFLISATHTSGDVAGVWDQYITAFQSAICTSNAQYFEEPPGGGVGPHGAGGDKGKYDTAANNLVSVHKVMSLLLEVLSRRPSVKNTPQLFPSSLHRPETSAG
jgi:hypothetical protein